MTEIERKALELCNEVQAERNHTGSPWNSPTILNEALYRAIEQNERLREKLIGIRAEIDDMENPFNGGGAPEMAHGFETAVEEAVNIVTAALEGGE